MTRLSPAQLAIVEGEKLYNWQIECLEAFGRGWPVSLVAANGSGKTAKVAARAVKWFFKRHPKGQLVCTSSSFNQLRNQLWPAIGNCLPSTYHVGSSPPLTILTPEGGKGVGFATNKAGRAEGWHPKVSKDVDPVFLLIDEAKTVPDAIWTAFDRCTVSYCLVISSPGPPFGRFFDSHHSLSKFYWTRRATSMDCPHIPAWKRNRDKEIHGEDSEAYRSMHLAEFTEGGEHLLMSQKSLRAALDLQPEPCRTGETVGFWDFARGGDENVFALRRGNEVRVIDAWRETDTTQAVRRFIRKAQQEGVPAECIWADADGLGGPMVDFARDEGFRVNEFHGGQAPMDPINYANLISEVWIQGIRRIERGKINLGELDKQSFSQLTNRYLQWAKTGKKQAEPKDKMKERGVKSPDRADAILGCIMCGSHMTGAITSSDVAGAEIGSSDFSTGIVTGW
jgi:hypothetical protein